MTEYGGAGAHRVFLRQALGGDEFLRVTWHERNDVFVFSNWAGDTCAAAIPVRVSELGDVASMIVAALAQRATFTAPTATSPWSAPDPAQRSDPGVARPAWQRRDAQGRRLVTTSGDSARSGSTHAMLNP